MVRPIFRSLAGVVGALVTLPAIGHAQDDFEVRECLAGEPSSNLGFSLAIDGDAAVIGAPFENGTWAREGAVYVYRLGPTGWAFEQELVPAEGAGPAEQYGYALAVEDDVIVVGSPGDKPSDDAQWHGAVHIYRHDGSAWNEETKVSAEREDGFGWSVALSGRRLVVGTRFRNYVQLIRYEGGQWVKKLVLRGDPEDERFGYRVDVEGDWIAAGAWAANDSEGAAYLFEFTSSVWQQRARLVAPSPQQYAYFGSEVSLAGDAVLVGAFAETEACVPSAGAAYVFRRAGVDWNLEQRLAPSQPEEQGWFGVDLALQGDEALVGAPDYSGSVGQGALYRFRRVNGLWQEEQRLTGAAGVGFGNRVARDGCTALIGVAVGDEPYRGNACLAVIPGIRLRADPSVVSSGDALTIAASGGTVGGICLLALVGVNGAPRFTPLAFRRFDEHCSWTLPTVVPPGLSGLVLSLQAFANARWSTDLSSEVVDVTFR